jgi:hypothetical protein
VGLDYIRSRDESIPRMKKLRQKDNWQKEQRHLSEIARFMVGRKIRGEMG